MNDICDLDFPFVGWIPTVLGSLSFRSIGSAKFPTRSKYCNIIARTETPAGEEQVERFIIAFQARNTSDAFLHQTFGTRKRSMLFVLHAKCIYKKNIGSDVLEGCIYLFGHRENWKENSRTRVRDLINDLNQNSLPGKSIEFKNSLSRFSAEAELLRSDSDLFVNFMLHRNGMARISQPIFRNSDVQNNTLEYARQISVDAPERISNQCYYFLRDMTHNHQHHAPDCDTIITLQKYDPDNEAEWKNNIAYALQYHVIDSKRRHDKSAMADALGVLAYRNSFMAALSVNPSRYTPDDVNLRASLSSRIHDEVPSPGFLQSVFGIWLSWVAVIVAIIAILLQPLVDSRIMSQIEDDQVGKLILTEGPKILVNNMPFLILFLPFLLFFIMFAMRAPKNRKSPKNRSSSALFDIYGLGQILNRKLWYVNARWIFMLTLILVGAALCWQSFHFFRVVKVSLF